MARPRNPQNQQRRRGRKPKGAKTPVPTATATTRIVAPQNNLPTWQRALLIAVGAIVLVMLLAVGTTVVGKKLAAAPANAPVPVLITNPAPKAEVVISGKASAAICRAQLRELGYDGELDAECDK